MKHITTIAEIGLLWAFVSSCEPATEGRSAVLGEWISVERPFPFESTLVIEEHGAFHYSFGACQTHGSTEGEVDWNDDTLRLTSNARKECVWKVPFDMREQPIIVGPDSLPLLIGEPSIPGCDPDFFGNEEVAFSHERFVLAGDTLLHVSRYNEVNSMSAHRFVRRRS